MIFSSKKKISDDESQPSVNSYSNFSSLPEVSRAKAFLKLSEPVTNVVLPNNSKNNIVIDNKIFSFEKLYINSEDFNETQELKLRKELFNSSICKIIEGFNSSFMIIEKNKDIYNLRKTEYASFIVYILDFLKKIFLDLASDNIIYLVGAQFFHIKEEEKEDLYDFFDDKTDLITIVEKDKIPVTKYFMDFDELMNYMNYKINSYDNFSLNYSKENYFNFSLSIFMNNKSNNLCWKGKLFLGGLFYNNISFEDTKLKRLFKLRKEKIIENENIFSYLMSNFLFENTSLTFYYNLLNKSYITDSKIKCDMMQCFAFLQEIQKLKVVQEKNHINEVSEYMTLIIDIQRSLSLKEYELYQMNMNYYMKEKELEQYKNKLIELENNLLFYEKDEKQNISIIDKDFEDHTPKSLTNNNLFPQTNSIPGRSITTVQKKGLHFFSCSKFASAAIIDEEKKTEPYEQFLEINYYDELMTLRNKFHKINKELAFTSYENEKLKTIVDKLKEQHSIFNKGTNIDKNNFRIESHKEDLHEILVKKDEEIIELKKKLWQYENYKENSMLYNYVIKNFDEIQKEANNKIEKLIEFLFKLEKKYSEETKLNVESLKDIMNLIKMLLYQLNCKNHSLNELLNEMNEIYEYKSKKKASPNKKE